MATKLKPLKACGDRFNSLINKYVVWVATGGEHPIGFGFFGDEFVEDNKTPEEAVANLWLKLNKNKKNRL